MLMSQCWQGGGGCLLWINVPLLCSVALLWYTKWISFNLLQREHSTSGRTLCYNGHVTCAEKLLIVFVTKMAHYMKLIISVHHEDIFRQPVKFPSFYSTRNPIFFFTTSLHVFLSTLSRPPSPSLNPIYLNSILILSSSLPSPPVHQVFPTKIL